MTTAGKISRRRLLRQALAQAAAGIALPAISCRRDSAMNPGKSSPNNQVGVGIIGCGRRNGQLLMGKGGQGKPPGCTASSPWPISTSDGPASGRTSTTARPIRTTAECWTART